MDSPVSRKRTSSEPSPGAEKRRHVLIEEGQCTGIQSDSFIEAVDFVGESELDIVSCHLFREEEVLSLSIDFMDKQSDVDSKLREALVNCLVQLHESFQLSWTSLFLTVNLLDRYLSKVAVRRSCVQLVGVTSLFVAAKFVEVTPPTILEIADSTNQKCRADDISSLECTFLNALDFRLTCPTADQFLDRLHELSGSDGIQRSLSCYLLELTLLDLQFLVFPPSHVASAATLLSRTVLGMQPAWPEDMAQFARYPEASLRGCMSTMLALATAVQPRPSAVHRKYMSTKHFCSWNAKLKALQHKQQIGRQRPVSSPVLKAPAPAPNEQRSAGRDHSGLPASNNRCESRAEYRMSPETLCGLQCARYGCDARRRATHRQAFEGTLRNSEGALKDMCTARCLPCSGSKEEMALRLIHAMFH